MSPYIIWTFRVSRRLKQALIRAGADSHFRATMNELDRILALAFPNAKELIVHDLYAGFRYREGEHILLVEVHDADRAGNYVLKVKASQASLQAEWDAWDMCRPPGLRHDLVFMTLEQVRDETGVLRALLYQDAQQFIGVEKTLLLEEAFVLGVRDGSPSAESLANVLTELFARVGHLLYQASRPVDARAILEERIQQNFCRWEQPGDPNAVRRIVNVALCNEPEFHDPVDFLRFVCAELQAGTEARPASALVPQILRGSAHGDLHGRNVLVGIIDNEAHWPALFDYEQMGNENYPGWDFVKLETELKIRVYPQVFPNMHPREFANRVYAFETNLGEKTEEHRRGRSWPTPAGATAEERLHNLLLVIRRLAGKHLGDAHHRPGHWLDEYYFLLAGYGVNAGKFENLNSSELIAAFVSAGVAASRYWHERERRIMEPGETEVQE